MGSNITMGLIFVMALNMLMWLSQLATANINPSGPEYFNCEGSMLDGFGDCETNYLNTSNVMGQLPTAESSVDISTGNIFTDTFRSIKNWVTSLPGVNYIYGMLKAPYEILKAIHLPDAFAFTLGAFWYGITLFLIIAFIWGRDV